MEQRAILSFAIQELDDEKVLSVTPVLDGTLLSELVSSFERENGLEPVGGYGGLVPSWFNAYGPLDRYFMAESASDYWHGLGGYYLLGCQCGEVGCWPLVGRIAKADSKFIWDSFRQPHRPLRDYSGFGPFVFDAEQYRAAALQMASEFAITRPD